MRSVIWPEFSLQALLATSTPFVVAGSVVIWAAATIALEYHWIRYAAQPLTHTVARIVYYTVSGFLIVSLALSF